MLPSIAVRTTQAEVQPWMTAPETAQVMMALHSGGGEARFAGGCVRDTLLNRPVQDIDIGTPHPPEKVMELCGKHNIRAIPTGIAHGTVTAVIGGAHFEITALRRDKHCDGRHAEVVFSASWRDDAARRDFTMNAMSMDVSGRVYDYFTGLEDLKEGVVRFVGDPAARIREDYLRILRLFRFHVWYGREKILPEQLRACAEGAEGIDRLSGERIQAEMLKLLAAPDPVYAVEAMKECDVLRHAIPGIDVVKTSILKNDILISSSIELDSGAIVRLACLLLPAQPDREQVAALAERWRLSNADKSLLTGVMFPGAAPASHMTEAEMKRLMRRMGRDMFFAAARLHWALERSRAGEEDEKILDNTFINLFNKLKSWDVPVFPLRGDDLMAYGVGEGRKLGEMLKKAEIYWESRDYKPDKAELLKFLFSY